MALTAENEADARTMVEEEGLTFPVLYGLELPDEADKVGADYDEEGGFFHATNFLLRGGALFHRTYSSGPLGRLRPDNVAGVVDFYAGD